MRILTAEEMAQVDRRAIEELGIPGMVLMENAALGVVEAIAEHFPEARRVAFFCGPGNNGGDGMAVARHLDARGYLSTVYLVLGGSEPGGDAGTQLEIVENSGLEVHRLRSGDDLAAAFDSALDSALAAAAASDLVVDALFGTGLSRPLGGHFGELVEALGEIEVPKVAVDLPSGLDASKPEPIGPYLAADLTVTFAAIKIAHVFPPAARAVGRLVVTDLGFTPALVDGAPGNLHLLTAEELSAYLIDRRAESHKGDYGHALIVGGAPGKAGAVTMAARAAVRGGAGLVTAAVPEPLLATVDGGSLESMTVGLGKNGLDGETLGAAAVEEVLEAASDKTAVALGPGLGTAEATVAAVREIVGRLELPLVLDADGLNAFAGRAEELAGRPAPTILTPHPGELARLLGVTTGEIQSDRIEAARRAAEKTQAIVVLKGHQTLVAEPGGGVWVNPTGNPGMASGGSGDVLTGLAAALLAQGYEALAAAQLGVFLHGLAGDLAAEEKGWEALRATDQIEALPLAFRRLWQAGG